MHTCVCKSRYEVYAKVGEHPRFVIKGQPRATSAFRVLSKHCTCLIISMKAQLTNEHAVV